MEITLHGVAIGYGGVGYGCIPIYALQDESAVEPERATPGRHDRSDHAPHYPRYRTTEEIRAARDAMWAVPKPVEKIVEKAAKRVIARAKTVQQVERPNAEPDPLLFLLDQYALQQRILEKDLRRKNQDFSLQFMILLRLEVERQVIEEREEIQILTLLMEM